MQYFGVPTCPYCRKRVNLIRTWSLKRQGEYQCPRCGGISNIFLSPLIYVFALLAVFAGGAVYFFHKFILDDISFSTVIQVLIPFAVFFLLSLFLVYLAKPVIKKIPRSEMKKGRKRSNFENRRQAVPEQSGRVFYDTGEYLPPADYRTGPLPAAEDDGDMKILPPSPSKTAVRQQEMQKTSVVDLPSPDVPRTPRPQRPPQPSPSRPASQAHRSSQQAAPAPRKASAPVVEAPPSAAPSSRPAVTNAAAPSHTVSHVDVPSMDNQDFFAKYNDPEYVERRLQELKKERGGKH